MSKKELDFSSVKITGKRVLLELPSQAAGGLIYVDSKSKALESGWFKVVAIGTDVTTVKVGEEAFVYFSHEPYHFDEVVFRPRKEQLADVESEKFAESIKVNIGSPSENLFKTQPVERKFCEIGEFDVHFVRDYIQEEATKPTVLSEKDKKYIEELNNKESTTRKDKDGKIISSVIIGIGDKGESTFKNK